MSNAEGSPAGMRNFPTSVLFVGNSLTYRGGGLDRHLSAMLPDIRTGRVVKGGATLERLLPLAETEIREGRWDAVILQDDLPETSVEAFLASVTAGSDLVRSAGARPYLLETWPYSRLGWIDADGIAEAHSRAVAATGITLVPAGRIWRRAAADLPDTDLLDNDREHPSTAGSWLTAGVLAAVLTGGPAATPAAAIPQGLEEDIARRLLTIAFRSAAGSR